VGRPVPQRQAAARRARKSDRKPVVAALAPKGSDNILRADEVESVPGPGWKAV
jgi:hypothetical protein